MTFLIAICMVVFTMLMGGFNKEYNTTVFVSFVAERCGRQAITFATTKEAKLKQTLFAEPRTKLGTFIVS